MTKADRLPNNLNCSECSNDRKDCEALGECIREHNRRLIR